MKRLLILFSLLLVAGASSAQNAKRVIAYNYWQDGEYLKAKEPIDEAVKDEKTGTDDKTWRYRGEIYIGLVQGEYEAINKVEAVKEAIKSFEKAIELDEKGKYKQENLTGLARAQNLAVNMGIQAYNNANYEKARDFFLIGANAAKNLGVVDTLAIYNAGLAAEQAEDFETAIAQYNRAIEVEYLGPKMFLYTANLYQRMDKQDEYLALVKKGREKYPEDPDLIVYELNYYLQNQLFEEALENLKLAIQAEPNNKQLYFSMGVVYDNLGNVEKAAEAYKKAIELDPDYFDAVYNLGALYFNQGVEMNNAANEIQDNAKYEAAREEAKEVFKKALPHLEKAHQLNPDDVGAIASLQQLYALLGQNDKYQEMKAKLDAVKAAE